MTDWIFEDGWEPPITGLFHVTGEQDTGKTWFTLTVPGVKVGEIIFFDDDMKTRGLAKVLRNKGQNFGYYIDMKVEAEKAKATKPAEFFTFFSNKIEEARKAVKNPKVVVYDNWSPRVEEAIRSYFMLSQLQNYSDISPNQARAISQFTWNASYEFYSSLLSRLCEIAPMVFIITHIKPQQIGQVKTGLLEARGQRPLSERANFRVWLRHNGDQADGGAPIGLIMKRFTTAELVDGQLRVVNVLPRRVKPFTWTTIASYMNNPVGARKLDPTEIPTPFELSIMDGELTPDQKDAMRMGRILEERENDAVPLEDEVADPKRIKARELHENGMPPPKIAAEMGLKVPEVLKLLG